MLIFNQPVMKRKILRPILTVVFSMLMFSCEKGDGFFKTDNTIDPNAASVESVLNNATRTQVSQLGVGLQASFRNGLFGVSNIYHVAGSVGREIIYSASTESRYYTELLGRGTEAFGGTNDPAGIMNGYYLALSSTRRRAEIFVKSADNSANISAQEKLAIRGFAKTIQAFAILHLANMQGKNGIRESFSDFQSPGDLLKPGPFGTYESALGLAKTTVDAGLTDLTGGGSAFPFTMTAGWTGFNTPATFSRFNRAVAARIAMYQKDWPTMLAALNASYLSLTGALSAGPVFTFSTTPGDVTNAFFQVANDTNAPYVVFEEFVTQAEAGDRRVFGANAKVRRRSAQRSSGGIISNYEVAQYPSNTTSIPIIKNEELILMYAEALTQLNRLPEAVAAINIIRTSADLPVYSGAADQASLITEVLKQRRYSLFFEGHRWFDAKRYNRFSELPLQTGGYIVFQNMARPDSEVQWDRNNP